jgi:hypothetical protein
VAKRPGDAEAFLGMAVARMLRLAL